MHYRGLDSIRHELEQLGRDYPDQLWIVARYYDKNQAHEKTLEALRPSLEWFPFSGPQAEDLPISRVLHLNSVSCVLASLYLFATGNAAARYERIVWRQPPTFPPWIKSNLKLFERGVRQQSVGADQIQGLNQAPDFWTGMVWELHSRSRFDSRLLYIPRFNLTRYHDTDHDAAGFWMGALPVVSASMAAIDWMCNLSNPNHHRVESRRTCEFIRQTATAWNVFATGIKDQLGQECQVPITKVPLAVRARYDDLPITEPFAGGFYAATANLIAWVSSNLVDVDPFPLAMFYALVSRWCKCNEVPDASMLDSIAAGCDVVTHAALRYCQRQLKMPNEEDGDGKGASGDDGRPGDRPDDLIDLADVAVKFANASKSTVRRRIKAGQLTDWSMKKPGSTQPVLVSEAECAKIFARLT